MLERLNADQELEVRAAYRETYSAQNHGAAIEFLYVTFTEKFGVSRATLRHVVTLELAENKKQYHKLRRELAERQAAKAGKAPTRKAKKVRAQARSASPPGQVCCPVCFKESTSVVIPRHENSAGFFCKGSWKRGVQPPKPKQRPKNTCYDDRADTTSVRTVSGGLPSSGRNRR
jgi:hypothetical protein